MVTVGIVGGAGYTGGELIRILLDHPEAELVYVHSRSNHGNPLSSVHTDLIGETDLMFTDAFSDDVDVIFLCLGHGNSRDFLETHTVSDQTSIIDLSQDYRLESGAGREWIYGLPELNREAIREANSVANPGCFATTIQTGLLPLAAEGKIESEIQVSAITGSTGAGQSPSPTTHFSWRSANISVYKAFTHQHLGEITKSLKQLQPGLDKVINFIPFRGNFARGILAAIHTKSDLTLDEAKNLFIDYYSSHPFVHVSGENPDVKRVVNTNKDILYLEKHDENLMIISVLDNLIKGASGQAVQNMNLMFGIDESAGLRLKASAF
ncbi:MAG: N-acetyl-gamma-glutamyl-phosphate reductase [Candidatus Marinimicrobia bacterium]|nr:N-acetyl-gamma-glutamyl-phosphate reductase [Candidatus Neomarinimicrobiota bacterium]